MHFQGDREIFIVKYTFSENNIIKYNIKHDFKNFLNSDYAFIKSEFSEKNYHQF
jgi:hypothetical protein